MAKIFRKNLLLTEILVVLLIILIGGFVFHYIEGYKILDSFYFIVMTMSTVGFGDVVPQTDIGKIFVMIYAFIGVPFFISIGGLILENRFRSTIEGYMKRVHKEIQAAEVEIHDAEVEIETVEKNVKKLKIPVQITEEKIENIEEKMDRKAYKEKNKTKMEYNKPRWKKIFRK